MYVINSHTADFIKRYTRSMETINMYIPEGTGRCGYLPYS